MGKTIGVMSFKGGVGKTVSAINLAAALHKLGKRVLVIEGNFLSPTLNIYLGLLNPEITLREILRRDMIPQEAIYEHKTGLHVLPCSFYKEIDYQRFKEKVKLLKQSYDYIVIDSGPSYTDEVVATLMVADELVFITTPDYPTLVSTLRAAELSKHKNVPVRGIIINKIRNKSFELKKSEIEIKTGLRVIAEILDDDKMIKASSEFMPIINYSMFNKNSSRYVELARKIIEEDQKESNRIKEEFNKNEVI